LNREAADVGNAADLLESHMRVHRLPLKPIAWLLFAAGCTAIAAHAFGYLYAEINPHNPFQLSFASAGWAVPAHFFGAGLALLLAPLQVASWLRRRWPRLHRLGGWLYVSAVLIGALSALLLAPRTQGGWINGASFLLLAPLWGLATGLALLAVIRGDIAAHRRWMLRSVAMTFAAVSLRLYLLLGLAGFGWSFASSYTFATWLCWPLNLALMELWLRRGRPAPAVGRRSGFRLSGA
jgi:uncharacterized membrane protein